MRYAWLCHSFKTKGMFGMRALMLVTAMLIGGCASQPASPPTPSSPAAAAPTADIGAQRLAQARNLNLKVVNKDGQQLFCRSNYMTTSRIQRDTTCYTADQLDKMEAQQQHELDQFNNQPARGAKNPFNP
jgi:PBP1b-binding outer membrane lipoprotein LpoB